MNALRRRWSQFSLRTLFVAVTLLCCWLAYQLNWIRQRHAFLAEPIFSSKPEPGRAYAVMRAYAVVMGDPVMVFGPGFNRPQKQLPWSLRIFGEPAVKQLFLIVEPPLDPKWPARAKDLFPEAEVIDQLEDAS